MQNVFGGQGNWFFLPPCGLSDWTQVVRLSNKCRYSLDPLNLALTYFVDRVEKCTLGQELKF